MFFISYSVSHSVTIILANNAAAEIAFECIKYLHIAFVLYHGEFRKNLKACRHFRMFCDPYVKTTFTVHETCDPFSVKLHWPTPNV